MNVCCERKVRDSARRSKGSQSQGPQKGGANVLEQMGSQDLGRREQVLGDQGHPGAQEGLACSKGGRWLGGCMHNSRTLGLEANPRHYPILRPELCKLHSKVRVRCSAQVKVEVRARGAAVDFHLPSHLLSLHLIVPILNPLS